MSLGNLSYDQSALDQYDADAANLYQFQMDPIKNFRPNPNAQGAGVFVDRRGNGQAQVDLESLLRNQSFVDSQSIANRIEADAQFAPYAQNTISNFPVENNLVPKVQYSSRACSQTSEMSIDRFDFLPQPRMGFQYGYGISQFGVNTVNAAKDQAANMRK